MKYICPVCFYNGLSEKPYDENGIGSDEICPCCGFQFGCDDFPDKDNQMILWRKKWIQSGCKWFSTSMLPPSDWLPPSFMEFSQCRNSKNDYTAAMG